MMGACEMSRGGGNGCIAVGVQRDRGGQKVWLLSQVGRFYKRCGMCHWLRGASCVRRERFCGKNGNRAKEGTG